MKMKKQITSALIGAIALFSITSCDPASQYKTELDEIESYLTRIDSLETKFDGIDFDSLNMMVKHVEKNEALIKELYQPDTLNAQFGRLMNDSKTIRKTLADVGGFESSIGDELNAVKHQLIDLKGDILAGLFSDEQIREYIDIEKEALAKVDEVFSDFYLTQEEETRRFYEVVPQVDAFIEELKEKSEIVE